jgi:hypothetical protein
MGEGRFAPDGVSDHGTQEEDGPGTWEALAFLDNFRSHGESGDPSPAPLAQADRAPGGEEKRPHRGRPPARGTGAGADEARESEGCTVASTSGNGLAPGPGRAKAARVDVSFRREPCPTHRRWETCHRDF